MGSHVERIKKLFSAFKEGGAEAVAPLVDPEVELRPLTGGGKVYRGPDGLRTYVREIAERGEEIEAEPVGFEEIGDCVIVAGRMRVRREAGSLTESQVTWVYRFNGERLRAARAFPGRLSPAEAKDACSAL